MLVPEDFVQGGIHVVRARADMQGLMHRKEPAQQSKGKHDGASKEIVEDLHGCGSQGNRRTLS